MNRVINWVFGSFFRTLGRVICYLALGALIGWILRENGLFLNVNAATLTSYNDTYNLAENQSCGSSGKYSYYLSDDSTLYSGSINSTITGKATALYFDFRYDLTANTYYDVSINGMLNDFTQNVVLSSFHVANGTSCGNYSSNNVSVVSLNKSSSSGQFKTIKLRIYASTSVDYWFISIFNDNNSNLTGVSNFGISSLSIVEVDMSNTDAILNNQNSNTDSVINNNNQNTQDIIDNQNQNNQTIIDNQNQNNEELKDTINDNFNSCRPSYNLFPGWIIGTGINPTTGVITSSGGSAISTDYIPVDFSTNSNYYLSGLSNTIYSFVAAYNSNKEFLGRTSGSKRVSISLNSGSFWDGSPTATGEIAYLRITQYGNSDTITAVNNLKTMLNVGSTALDYEEYGKEVCTNKLDDTNDKLDNLTGAITDSTPPNVDDLGNAAGWLPPGPVDTIANLPITFFQTLLGKINKSCKPIELELPFVKQNLILPCASSILSQLGNFNGWWEAFGFIAAAWCLYKYFINFYKWVESALSLDEKESLGKWGGV